MGQKAILEDCATKEGVWKGPIRAEAGAEAEPEPEQGETPTGRKRRGRRGDNGAAAPARKRARK